MLLCLIHIHDYKGFTYPLLCYSCILSSTSWILLLKDIRDDRIRTSHNNFFVLSQLHTQQSQTNNAKNIDITNTNMTNNTTNNYDYWKQLKKFFFAYSIPIFLCLHSTVVRGCNCYILFNLYSVLRVIIY